MLIPERPEATDPPDESSGVSGPGPGADPSLVAALRSDLIVSEYRSDTVDALLGPVSRAALAAGRTAPARRELAGSAHPAALLFRLLTLGVTVTRAALDAALPSLGTAGAIELGLVTPAPESDHDPALATEAETDTGRGTAREPGVASASVAAAEHSAHGDEHVRALIDLHPYESVDAEGTHRWWIASDLSEQALTEQAGSGSPELPPDHTLGVGSASTTLASITPRTRVDRVLDLGTGSGVQAILATRHAGSVVATDLSARALRFAALTARLNQVELDLRAGSFLEPVAGEEFDLIVSNPPFVITPRGAGLDTYVYRDAGGIGDGPIAHLIRDLPGHLAPGGIAVMLADWEVTGDDWTVHPRRWCEAAAAAHPDRPVQARFIQRELTGPDEYAATWIRDGGTLPGPGFDRMEQAWIDDFSARGILGVGLGYVVLRRPTDDETLRRPTGDEEAHPGRRREVAFAPRFEEHTGEVSEVLGDHLAESLRRTARLPGPEETAAIAALRLRVAPDVTENRYYRPGHPDPELIELTQGAGLRRRLRVSTELAAVLGACDGELTVGQLTAGVAALLGEDASDLADTLSGAVRQAVIDGFADPVECPVEDPVIV